MSTAAGASANLPQATAQDVDTNVRSILAAGDNGAAQAVSSLTLIQRARVSQLTRNAATLTKQLGADNAETKAAEAALTTAATRVSGMTVAQLQSGTPSPQVSATGWALHGRVFDGATQPIGKLTVFLADSQKKFQSEFGYSYSDSTGYFLINYPGAQDKAKARAQLFVAIINAKRQHVYLSDTPFSPTPGTATYQNIFLPDGAKPLGDPPKGVRRAAFPRAS